MPFILAIEPDRRQAARINALARHPLNAEIVITETAEAAVAAIAQRVPDLILTPRLLSPRDEAILDGRLRELDAAGRHVQTLMIPLLGSPNRKAGKKESGLLNRLRWTTGDDAANGCDPAVFAAEIAQYLEGTAADRAARTAHDEDAHVEQAAPPVEAKASRDADAAANEMAPPAPATEPSAASISVDSLQLTDAPQPQEPWQDIVLHGNGEAGGDISIQPEELNAFVDTLEAQLATGTAAQEEKQPPPVPEPDPLVTEFSVDSDGPLPVPAAHSSRPPAPSPAIKPAKKPGVDVNDEWGLFNPQKVGFATLIAKLQEITE